MDYHNADGSVAEMCGNGIRVFTAFLLEQGLAELPEGGTLPIGTRSGVHAVTRAGGWLRGGARRLAARRHRAARSRSRAAGCTSWPRRRRRQPARRRGAGERRGAGRRRSRATSRIVEPAPEHGANVEFVVPADPLVVDGVGHIRMRVHERGAARRRPAAPGRQRRPWRSALRRQGCAGLVERGCARRHGRRAGGRRPGARCRAPADLVFDGELTV